MIAAAWEYGRRPVQFLGEYGSSGSSLSVENDNAKSIRSDGDTLGIHAVSTEPEPCRSKSNNWGELQTDPPNLYDSPCSPDGTLLNSSRVSSEISADTQGREIPCSKFTRAPEGISYDTSVRNLTDRANPEAFDGSCSKPKHEYNFPKWSLPSKIRRKFSVPNKDSTDNEAVTSKSPDHSDGDHGPHSHTGSRNIAPRVCADCSTTKTPLWRSGPQGPKSLCNACGIRYRKKRRALIASGSSDAATSIPSRKRNKSQLIAAAEKKIKKCFTSDQVEFMAFCQRHGVAALKDQQSTSFLRDTSPKISILQKHSAIQRRFAEEEEEAAVLLMALSYGVVNA